MEPLTRVLVVEDKHEVVEAISLTLRLTWPEVNIFETFSGIHALDLTREQHPQIIILDLGLPDITGFEVIEKIRLFSNVPIVILTISSIELDVVRALQLGADEYLVKPFRPMELVSRLEATLRRKMLPNPKHVIGKSCVYEPIDKRINIKGKQIELTAIENSIVKCLVFNSGQVVTVYDIAQYIWGDDYPEDLRSLKVYIRRLRIKLEEDPNHPSLILTKVGVGYFWAEN